MGGLDITEEEEEDAKKHPDAGFCRVMKYYNPLWMAIFGVLLAIASAAAFPLFGIFMARVLFVVA